MTHKVKGLEFDELPHPISGVQLEKNRQVLGSPFLTGYVGKDLVIHGISADGEMVSFGTVDTKKPEMCAKVSSFQNSDGILARMVTA